MIKEVIKMNKEELYKDFRNELDKYAIPLIIKNENFVRLINEENEIGFACIYGNYLDAFYIFPKYRRKGLGSITAKNLIKMYNIKELHIININTPAINFWNKNFKLIPKEINFCDTLYEIVGVKE